MIEKLKVVLFVLLLAGVFTACSDDETPAPAPVVPDVEVEEPESDEPTAEELAEMAVIDKFTAANSVIRALAEIDSLPDNWENSTFEAQVGFAVDEANTDIRNVIATGVEDAENYFYCIVPDLGLEGHTWSHEGIGTLTFRAVNEADCYAVLDVNLVHMPGLKQLRFVPQEVVGDNKLDNPYYFAGDVVKDKDGIYWICIRPAGGPEGKGKAYFATFEVSKFVKEYPMSQLIYGFSPNGKIDKEKRIPNSGKWVYYKNLLEERMALAAAHTFAMMKIADYFRGQYREMQKAGFSCDKFDTSKDPDNSNVFGCNIAYGNYVSNKYTKVRQEKYLQPFMRISYNKVMDGFKLVSYVQAVEKVVLDSKMNSTPYLLSLTTDYNPTAFDLLFPDNSQVQGYEAERFDVTKYCWKYDTRSFEPIEEDMFYLKGYLDERVLLMAQTSIRDNGKPHKDFEMITTGRVNRPNYWESISETKRILYDQKNNGKIFENITD